MQIGELSRCSGMSRDTLRYYEKEGLLGEVPRMDNGYRDYPRELVRRLHWIQELKSLGITLPQVKELLDLPDMPGVGCKTLHRTLEDRLQKLDDQIQSLQSLRNTVAQQLESCRQSPDSSRNDRKIEVAASGACDDLAFCNQ